MGEGAETMAAAESTKSKLPVERLEICNFRGIEHLVLEDCGRVNLLFGDNGCGKTTVLEAIALASWGRLKQKPLVMDVLHFKRRRSMSSGEITHAEGASGDSLINLFVRRQAQNKTITIEINKDKYFKMSREEISEAGVFDVKILIEDKYGKKINVYDEKTKATPGSYAGNSARLVLFPDDRSDIHMIFSIATRKTENKKNIIEQMRKFKNDISDIELSLRDGHFDKNSLYCRFESESTAIPIEELGDGFIRALHVLCHLFSRERGNEMDAPNILLVDEIEVGLHFRRMPEFWRFLLIQAERLNVQIFATTHSLDAIRALGEALNSLPDVDAVGFRLEPKAEYTRAVRYDRDSLVSRLEDDVEMR